MENKYWKVSSVFKNPSAKDAEKDAAREVIRAGVEERRPYALALGSSNYNLIGIDTSQCEGSTAVTKLYGSVQDRGYRR